MGIVGVSRDYNKLSAETSDKLCAAQVIPDLPSIIKELIDNSIDAKAKIIKIQLYEHGRKRVEVVDNGNGIPLEDLKGIAHQGATSKLEQFEDINKVGSLGFRGQALCSIANISRMKIESMHSKSRVGYQIDLADRSLKEVDTSYGTKITLDDIYYSLPARRALLETQTISITNHILELLKQYSLIYVHIQFILQNSHNGKNDNYFDSGYGKHFDQNSWKERIGGVLGSKVASGLVHISSEFFEGWIMERVLSGSMKPEEWLKRKVVYLYCNRRPINFLESITSILDEVYKEYNSSSKYVCILNLKFDDNEFDVNVSPDKRQIYWANEQQALKVLRTQIQGITEKSRNQVKSLDSFIERKSIKKPVIKEETQGDVLRGRPSKSIQDRLIRAMGSKPKVPEPNSMDTENNSIKQNNPQGQVKEQKRAAPVFTDGQSASIDKKDFSRMKVIGQFNCGFIICQLQGRFFLVDQHSADEKSNYQQILNSKYTLFVTNTTIPLSPDQYDRLCSSGKMKGFGYKYQAYSNEGKYFVSISQMPVYFGEVFKEDFFMETLESGIESFVKHPMFQKRAATYACRKSIMIGDSLRRNQMERVVSKLSVLESPWNCPHGRPTSILLNSVSSFISEVRTQDEYTL